MVSGEFRREVDDLLTSVKFILFASLNCSYMSDWFLFLISCSEHVPRLQRNKSRPIVSDLLELERSLQKTKQLRTPVCYKNVQNILSLILSVYVYFRLQVRTTKLLRSAIVFKSF